MKSDIPDKKQDNLLEDLEDLTPTSPDKESLNEDLSAGAPSDRQIDESPSDLTTGMSSDGNVDESLYDDLFENSSANNELDNISIKHTIYKSNLMCTNIIVWDINQIPFVNIDSVFIL